MVSELEKFLQENYKKFVKNQGVSGALFMRTVFYYFFSFHGGIRCSQVEIKFGKNSKVKDIHAH